MVEGAEEASKKRSRMQELQVRERNPCCGLERRRKGKIVQALEYIGKGLAALVQIVEDSNRHLAAITDYVGQCKWDLEDRESKEEDEDEESEEECSGDEEVARGLGS